MSHWTNTSYSENKNAIHLVLTPSSAARAFYFFVQEIGHTRAAESFATGHRHLNSYLILYTLSGQGKLQYRGQEYATAAGDLFFIDCTDTYHYETRSETSGECLWMYIQGSTLHEYYNQFNQRRLPVCRPAESTIIPDLIRQLIHIQHPRTSKTELLSSQIIVQLLTDILLTAVYHEKNSSIPTSMLDLQTYLENHYTESITLDDLADKYSTNKFQLSRDFKHYIGLPPIEYLINIRINAAKHLLRHSKKSIQQIANEVGIYNVSHFINLFKARVESTPLAYRKEWTASH